jgi:hypothetical protein
MQNQSLAALGLWRLNGRQGEKLVEMPDRHSN